ncbi:MAG: TonB-dependent receptor [Terracidiphilus sp.]
MIKFLGVLLLLSLCWPASYLAAQEFTGHVTDSSGAVLTKAAITAHNVATNVDTATVTTAAGDYTIPYLKPGNYTVSVQANGFETGLRTGLVLQVGQTATVNFALNVGHATETVIVQGDSLIDFGKADIGEVVENTRVTELPLNGRDPGMLSILSAGAIWTGSAQWQRPFDDTQANLAVNGGQGGNVSLMMDGVSNSASPINNAGQANIAYVPPVDSVQEFKIITNPYDAQYGLMAGAVEDVRLKSGTNQLHGDVYEYARRTWLDANTWQNDYTIAKALPGTNLKPYETPTMKWDQYGAELDGPVVLPKIYNGRDKSFFTMQFENWNEIEPNTIYDSVPGAGWSNGDFSNLVYWNGTNKDYEPISILDPLNISQNAQGAWVRVPFGPNDTINPTSTANVMPASRINPVAQKIISLYPKANTTTAPGSNPFANNYTVPGNDVDRYRNVLAKFDQNLSSKDRLSLHYGYWERVEVRSYDGFTGPEQEGQLPHGERSHTFTLEETHTFTPSLFFDFRANASVRADYSYNGPPFDPTTLGWSSQLAQSMGPAAAAEFPYLNISEFASMGTNSNGQNVKNSLALFPTVTWVKGKHTLHAGLDLRLWQIGYDVIGGGNNFWIDRSWTQTECGSCGSWDPASGNSIASLLLGNPTSGSNQINVKTYWSSHYWAPFAQDDWKVNRRLTLNLGVRWDFVEPETERNNMANGGFNSTAVNPVNSLVSLPGYSQLLGGVTYLGVNGYARSAYPLSKFDLQPRVGFAYALNDKTVVRGGFGESARSPENAPNNIGYSASTNYQANDPNWPGATHPNLANQINNPYSSVVQPTGSSLGMLEDLGQGPWTINPKYIIPTFWNYSMGVERQFLRNDTINISYVGSQLFNGDCGNGSFKGDCPNINHESAAAMTDCNPENGGRYENCSNDNVPNPFLGINAFNGSGYNTSSTLNALNFTRPFPEFQDMTMWQANTAHTWYNSLQVTGTHKWSNSLTLHGTWTWSKMLDAGGVNDTTFLVPFRQIDGNDFTHRITVSGVYLLPVGHGRTFLSNANRIVNGAIGGWELGSLYVYQTGAPWLIPGNPNEIYLHSAYVKPHIQKDDGFIRLAAACAEQYQENNSTGVYSLVQLQNFDYDGSCSQGANFEQVPSYAPSPDNVYTGIRIPRTQQFDTNLSKNFGIVERMSLQLRLEAFNVLNHPLWSENPDGSTNDSTFGTIERGPWGQSNLPRQMQVSAKINW